jgi:hypothetical protein
MLMPANKKKKADVYAESSYGCEIDGDNAVETGQDGYETSGSWKNGA